jgi:hypothetical protein
LLQKKGFKESGLDDLDRANVYVSMTQQCIALDDARLGLLIKFSGG